MLFCCEQGRSIWMPGLAAPHWAPWGPGLLQASWAPTSPTTSPWQRSWQRVRGMPVPLLLLEHLSMHSLVLRVPQWLPHGVCCCSGEVCGAVLNYLPPHPTCCALTRPPIWCSFRRQPGVLVQQQHVAVQRWWRRARPARQLGSADRPRGPSLLHERGHARSPVGISFPGVIGAACR